MGQAPPKCCKWLAQGTGDEAGNVLFPDFFLISKKALESLLKSQGTSPSKRPLSSSWFKISCKSPTARIRKVMLVI